VFHIPLQKAAFCSIFLDRVVNCADLSLRNGSLRNQEVSMSVHKHVKKSIIVFIFLALALAKNCFAQGMTLEEYVNAPDEAFEYKLVKTAYTFLYTTYIFEITSQKWHPGKWDWHSEDIEDDGKWKHWLTIVEPRLFGQYTQYIPFFSLVRSDKVLLYLLRGDADHEDRPSAASPQAVQQALSSFSIVAELHGIPIGPIAFNDETDTSTYCSLLEDIDQEKYIDECTEPRSEDSLQARSFDLALEEEDFTWALMAPMTKAAVRGMDVIQDFLQQRYLWRPVAKEFVLTGHSKRGHIVWLTAALDDRVAGVAPVSYDLLNIAEQIALQDYSWPDRSQEQDANEEFDLYTRYKTPLGQELIADVDPYAYRDRLTIPGLILVGTGDPYSCSDAVNLYFDYMSEDTRIFYAPNQGHDIRELPDVESALGNFFRHSTKNKQLPDFTWTGLEGGAFNITPGQQKPEAVKLWSATNPVNRDFRFTPDNQTWWTSTDIEASANGLYTGTVPSPGTGSTAYYIELLYKDTAKGAFYSLATPLTILGQ
jgi:PhoPQ-activated pathogenicity-related protein